MGRDRVISTQYAIHIKVKRRKYRRPGLYRVHLLVRKKRCPFAPQQYHERLINSRPWVVMQRYEGSYQGPTDKILARN